MSDWWIFVLVLSLLIGLVFNDWWSQRIIRRGEEVKQPQVDYRLSYLECEKERKRLEKEVKSLQARIIELEDHINGTIIRARLRVDEAGQRVKELAERIYVEASTVNRQEDPIVFHRRLDKISEIARKTLEGENN